MGVADPLRRCIVLLFRGRHHAHGQPRLLVARLQRTPTIMRYDTTLKYFTKIQKLVLARRASARGTPSTVVAC
jgi:hypothetical protein